MGCELYIIKRRCTMQDTLNPNTIQENSKKYEVKLEKFLKPLKYYYGLRDNEFF